MVFVTLACLQLYILLRGLVQTNGQREVRTEELTVKITDAEFENPPPLPRPCSPLITPSHHTSFLEFTRFPSLSFNTPLSLSLSPLLLHEPVSLPSLSAQTHRATAEPQK